MSVLSDRWIKKMALEKEMIKPFVSEQKKGKIISYGLSFFGSTTAESTLVIVKSSVSVWGQPAALVLTCV